MTIFVINVGDTEYSQYSIPLIQKLAEYNNINLFVLDRDIKLNINKAHPSWLKLFCHDIIDDDFILTWDLDLVPTRLYDLPIMNKTMINMCYDISYINNIPFNYKFKYNCGLIGISKSYSNFCKEIYRQSASSKLPSYEQYHFNNSLYDNSVEINLLPQTLNNMYSGIIDHDSLNIHYTYKIGSNENRKKLIFEHYNLFKDNFI